jgi:predicted nucleotide-binding protein (sugar kinase/HSP70/actin superfamily)
MIKSLKLSLLDECEIFSCGVDDATTLSQIKEEIETTIASLTEYLNQLNERNKE